MPITGGLWLPAKHHQARLLPSPLLGIFMPHLNDSTARHYRTWSQCFPQSYQHSLRWVRITLTDFHVGTRKSVQWKALRVPNARNDTLIIFRTDSLYLRGLISSCINNCCMAGLRLAYASVRLHFYHGRMILCSFPSTDSSCPHQCQYEHLSSILDGPDHLSYPVGCTVRLLVAGHGQISASPAS